MSGLKSLSILWLGVWQAATASHDRCARPLAFDDATLLYQRHLRAQQDIAFRGPKIDLANFDPANLGKMIPRQTTPAEIEAQVRAAQNYTASADLVRQRTEMATEPLSIDATPGDLGQMVQRLTVALGSVQDMADEHLQALNFTLGVIARNSPPFMAMAASKSDERLKSHFRKVSLAAGRAKSALNKSTSPSDLCNEASTFLSEFRTQVKLHAKACDMVLYLIPPPLPPENPWVNSTLVEAMRSMYTQSKFSAQDAGDSIEMGVSTFLRNGAGCEPEVTDSSDAEDDAQFLAQGKDSKQHSGSVSRLGCSAAAAFAVAASLFGQL